MGARRQERSLQHLPLGRPLGCPQAAIANAIYDALGVRIKELPLSAEKVLAALQGQDGPEYVIDVEALRKTEADQR